MIKFRQKQFTEYDAMRSLYVELMKRTKNDRQKFPIIDTSALIPILKGNNIVIERFVISSSLFGRDKFRMYLKIGAKAKMPDEVRLTGVYYDKRLGNLSLNIQSGIFAGKQDSNNGGGGGNGKGQQGKTFSETPRQKIFGKGKGGGGNNKPNITAEFSPSINITKEVLQVLYIDKNSQTDLIAGDTILKVDGISLKAFGEIKGILVNHEIGDRVEVEYLRDDKEYKGYFIVREMDGEKKAGLYLIKIYDYDVKRKINLEFDSREGGPSGGFMLSLAIYNRLVPEDLTKGRKIVGTGTIDTDGNVGEIGGVKYKVMGANSGDADIFFVPEENYEEAINFKEEKGYDLNIVKVKTLSDAIEYLRRN